MCGIFGYTGKGFNIDKFNILGLYNDTRGGDSCGIFFKNNNNGKSKVYHYAEKMKLYKSMLEANHIYGTAINGSDVVLGHCRKASVGSKNIEQAQPCYVKEGDQIKFVMIHNGTLINYIELAKKYDVEYSNNETDSQIFCKIVYKVGYDVLSEYNGAGAFVFWNSEFPKQIKVFKGESRQYQKSTVKIEERPLYILQTNKGLWFSSTEDSLSAINNNFDLVIDIESNKLFTIEGKNIIDEKEYPREDNYQIETTVVTNYESYGSYWNNQANNSTEKESNISFVKNYCGFPKKFIDEVSFSTSWRLLDRLDNVSFAYTNDRVYYSNNGKYMIGIKECDGCYLLSKNGQVVREEKASINDKKYYFIRGMLMKSYLHYLGALEYIKEYFEIEDGDDLDEFDVYLCPFAAMPIPWTFENGNTVFYTDNKSGDPIVFTGTYCCRFGYIDKEYGFIDGHVKILRTDSTSDPRNSDKYVANKWESKASRLMETKRYTKEQEDKIINQLINNIYG